MLVMIITLSLCALLLMVFLLLIIPRNPGRVLYKSGCWLSAALIKLDELCKSPARDALKALKGSVSASLSRLYFATYNGFPEAESAAVATGEGLDIINKLLIAEADAEMISSFIPALREKIMSAMDKTTQLILALEEKGEFVSGSKKERAEKWLKRKMR